MGRSNALTIRRQVAFFVEAGDDKNLGVWTEYEVKGNPRSHIGIQMTCRMLFPTDKIGVGIKRKAYDVPFGLIQEWLKAKGYHVLGPMIDTA